MPGERTITPQWFGGWSRCARGCGPGGRSTSSGPPPDSSPIPERAAALCAGLGVLGDNGLVLLDKWGSWIFLGTILTNLTGYPWPEPSPAPVRPLRGLRRRLPRRGIGGRRGPDRTAACPI